MREGMFLLVALMSQAASALTMNFDDLKAGDSLKNWEMGFYSAKGAPVWTIEKDPSAPSPQNVLRQSGYAIYSWAVDGKTKIENGTVEADMKVISGTEDPEVGLVWRHLDGKNYFYVRINALEDNVIFYRMNNGKKESIKEADTKVGFNQWHHLKASFAGDQVDIFFDGKPLINVRNATVSKSGKVGFFTTADTVGAFDNFKAETNKKETQ